MKNISSLFLLANLIILLLALERGVETQKTPKTTISDQHSVESTGFLAEKSAYKETLLASDRYLYPGSDFEFSLLIKNQYTAVVAELKGFVNGLEFDFRKFQLLAPRLKQRISIIHESVEHRERNQEKQRNLETFYVFPNQMLNTMQVSADAMRFWADVPHNEGNLISEVHQLRVITISLFTTEGAPDINMKGFTDQVQGVDRKWTVLKDTYDELKDKRNIRELFSPILAKIRRTIDVLQKTQSEWSGVNSGFTRKQN